MIRSKQAYKTYCSLLFSGLALMATLSLSFAETRDSDFLDKAISGTHRSAENVARDQFRHPRETLAFFEVEPDMTVVEIWPGAGWYTEILAPYLAEKGQLIAAHFPESSDVEYYQRSRQGFIKKIENDTAVYGKMVITELLPPAHLQMAAPGTADRILTFRNIHNWMKAGYAEAMFQAMYTALKPGGYLGVVEHRAKNDNEQDPKASSGYVREDYIIALAEKAGFELLETSEINANLKDTTEHPNGVWSLLPRLRVDEKSRSSYEKIGESDRMTLKFVKAR